jgi:hypothetical protein
VKSDPKDSTIPTVLIVIAFILIAIAGYRMGGADGPLQAIMILSIASLITTTLMIFAAFITASLIGVSFGELRTASLKLSAIYLFSTALALFIPYGGILIFFLWLGLLMWLFELEVYQAVVFSIVLWVVNFLVGLALRGMFRS